MLFSVMDSVLPRWRGLISSGASPPTPLLGTRFIFVFEINSDCALFEYRFCMYLALCALLLYYHVMMFSHNV